jgi:pimeloyl-ACP methyl ester carboxylesterase
LPALQLAISTLPESAVVTLALSQPALLGLSSDQAAALGPLVARRYQLIAASREFSPQASLLPYCYAVARPSEGAALMYVPDGVSPRSPVVVFLHGFGGSFQWYLHWLAEALPRHVIIAPAYGISPVTPDVAYLTEAVAAASQHLRLRLATPALLGLSAGGFGACRAFVSAPRQFSQLVCLAAYPPAEVRAHFRQDQRLHFLAGAREGFVVSGQFAAALQQVRAKCPLAAATLIAGGEHFFMLTHAEDTRVALRKALAQ